MKKKEKKFKNEEILRKEDKRKVIKIEKNQVIRGKKDKNLNKKYKTKKRVTVKVNKTEKG